MFQQKTKSPIVRGQMFLSLVVLTTYFYKMFTGTELDTNVAESFVVVLFSIYSMFSAYNNPERKDRI